MNLPDFKNTLTATLPPSDTDVYLKALWYDGKEDWEKAHELIQDITDEKASWIHAYLHRKEGDIWNADYWYKKARKKRSLLSLNEEWNEICTALL